MFRMPFGRLYLDRARMLEVVPLRSKSLVVFHHGSKHSKVPIRFFQVRVSSITGFYFQSIAQTKVP
jgi:hypothetical protein